MRDAGQPNVAYSEWRRQNPEPDLQALAEQYGGLGNVPPEAWADFDRAREEWSIKYHERRHA